MLANQDYTVHIHPPQIPAMPFRREKSNITQTVMGKKFNLLLIILQLPQELLRCVGMEHIVLAKTKEERVPIMAASLFG